MSDAQTIVDLVEALRNGLPWTVSSVAFLVGLPLERDKRAPENLKRYVGTGTGLIREVRFRQPTYLVPGGATVQLTIDWGSQIPQTALGALIPANAPKRLHSPAAPGGKGGERLFFSISVADPRANAGFTFERRDQGTAFLNAISLLREKAAEGPADHDSESFQPYAVREGAAETYAIERRSTGRDAVVVTLLGLANRTLKLSFVAVEPMIGEPLARRLILELILGTLLKDELAGKYDQVALHASELDSTTIEPAR